MKIKIKGKDVTMRYSMRSMMIYEKVMNASFNPKGLTEILAFFYCVILGSCKDINLTFDEFIDWIDENPEEMQNFNEWLMSVFNKNGYIKQNEKTDGGDDSKNV